MNGRTGRCRTASAEPADEHSLGSPLCCRACPGAGVPRQRVSKVIASDSRVLAVLRSLWGGARVVRGQSRAGFSNRPPTWAGGSAIKGQGPGTGQALLRFRRAHSTGHHPAGRGRPFFGTTQKCRGLSPQLSPEAWGTTWGGFAGIALEAGIRRSVWRLRRRVPSRYRSLHRRPARQPWR